MVSSAKNYKIVIMDLYTGLVLQGLYLQILLLCVIHVTSLVTVPPVFNTRPRVINATVNSRVELPCSVSHLGSHEVIWKKNSQSHALTIGTYVFVKDDRFRVKHVPYNDEWNLVINGVQKKHGGVYECQLSTKKDMQQYVTLNVVDVPIQDPPDLGILIRGPKHVLKGHPIRLTCNSTKDSDIEDFTTWFHNGKIVRPDARRDILITHLQLDRNVHYSELIIKYSKIMDSGKYSCRYDRKVTHHTLVVESGSNNTRRGANLDTQGNLKTEPVQSNRNGKPGIRISSVYMIFISVLISTLQMI